MQNKADAVRLVVTGRTARATVCTTVAIGILGCRVDPTSVGGGGLHQRWYQPQAGYGQSRPAISNASVMFATVDGQIFASETD
jgi:hypothetical protein